MTECITTNIVRTRSLASYPQPILDDESTNWVKLVASLEPYDDHHAVDVLCDLACCHTLPEVRAAAISALGFAPVWARSLVSQLQEISDAAHGDPIETVREAAAGALRVLQRPASPDPPLVRPSPVQLVLPPAQPHVQQPMQLPANDAERAKAKTPAMAKAPFPLRPSPGEVETEPEFLMALQQSESEALQQEQQHVHKAFLRSKHDITPGNATLFRLAFHKPQVTAFILNFPALAGCRSRVESAGCSVQPTWANGALVLLPASQEQVEEAGIVLMAHNILMLDSDKVLLEDCLAQLSRRKRPQLKLQQYPGGTHANSKTEPISVAASEHGSEASHEANILPGDWIQDAGLIVERTFLSFPVDREISDASTIVHSAPAATQTDKKSLNPHQWRLPSLKDAEGAPDKNISSKCPENV